MSLLFRTFVPRAIIYSVGVELVIGKFKRENENG